MDSFLTTVFKGLFPPYLFLAILGAAVTIRTRRWRSFDTLLLAFFVVFELFAVFQVWLFYGEFDTTQRYMWIAIPLYLPFVARGVTALWDILKRYRPGRIAAPVFAAAFVAAAIVAAYNPIYKWTVGKKHVSRMISRQAAAWIRNDWGTAANDLPKIEKIRCDHYQSGRRPVVLSECMRIGYMCGGQVYVEFLRDFGVCPDYILTQDRNAECQGYVLVKTITVEGQEAYIYKRAEKHP